MAALAILKTLTPASASPNKQKRRFNKMMPNTFKRILCAVMALVLMVALLPAVSVTAEAAGTTDAAIFFSDLHGQNPVNYKNEADPDATAYKTAFLTSIMTALKGTGLPFSSITSAGDAFSVNGDSEYNWVDGKNVYNGKYTGYTSIYTNTIQNVINVPVNYVWSDHDRYAVELDGTTPLNKTSHLAYSGNYYVYVLSMADISTDDRYKAGFETNRAANGFTESVSKAIENFQTTVTGLDKTKPLFIASHQPLLENRGDNENAYLWYQAITEVAEEMDVIFLHGHNHKYDKADEYYYAKGDTMNVAGDGSSKELPLNFTHLVTGYLNPDTTGSTSNTTREGTVIVASITDDNIQLTTYCATGKYTGNYAVDVSVNRDHAMKHYYIVIPTATCTEGGYNMHLCTDCGDSYMGDFVEALGHTYSVQVVAPTCYKAGYSIYTCDFCGDSYHGDEVDALTHEYVAVVTPPTCNSEGYTTYKCKFCTSQYEDNFIDALDHNYTVAVEAPTCTTVGFTSHICQDCGHRYNDSYVSALGHNYEATVVAPTCTEQGYTKHTCSNCGDYHKDTYVSAPGHNSTVVVTAPTCTEQGYSTFTCMDCDNVTVGNYVAEKGHIYSCVQSGDLVTYSCKNCNHSYSMATESNYSYNKVTKLANNDTYVITMYVNKQYYALSHEDNKISAVPVTVSNGKITSEVSADILWTCKSNKLCYTYNGITRYLNASSTRLSVGGSGATVSFSSSKLKIGTNYLRYANGSVSLNKTASTTYLFNQVEN